MKYLGVKPRGFTVLTARPKTGRAVAGEFNSPRPSRNGPVGINTRTPSASVRVGRSTTTRQHPSHHVKDAGFEGCRIPRNCAQVLRIKVVNPRRNWTRQYGGMCHIAYAIHPRGQVVRDASRLVITEDEVFRTTPRHSRCISVDVVGIGVDPTATRPSWVLPVAASSPAGIPGRRTAIRRARIRGARVQRAQTVVGQERPVFGQERPVFGQEPAPSRGRNHRRVSTAVYAVGGTPEPMSDDERRGPHRRIGSAIRGQVRTR